jgi:hypothetical protein
MMGVPTLEELATVSSSLDIIGTIVRQIKEMQKGYDVDTAERKNLTDFAEELRYIKAKVEQDNSISDEQRKNIQTISEKITSLARTNPPRIAPTL